MNLHYIMLLLLLLFHFNLLHVILLITPCTCVSFVGKSSIETCSNNGVDSMNCNRKIYLAFTVQNAELSETDSFEVVLNGITNTTTGDTDMLLNPIKITISKTPVYAIYPVIYVQDFNYHPKEKIVSTDLINCEDGDLSSNPTCGWQYDIHSGKKIPHSQGFCCKCNFGQIIGTSSSSKRGSQCQMLNLGIGSATAHCLVYDELWWGAYEIKNYSFDYTVSITIQNYTHINSSEIMYLSPSDIIATTPDKNIIARIIGDFLPSTLPIDYSEYYLLIPKHPISHSMVQAETKYWMLVKSSLLTFDGSECDKIGISYYAFRTQGDRCEVGVSTCINNQIYDLLQSDNERIQKGQKPLYLINEYIHSKFFFFASAQYDVLLAELMEGNANTLITLELNADDVKFIINVSEGAIDYVKVDTFESMSNNGVMIIQITNTGETTSKYYISYNCSGSVLPINGREFSLSPMQSIIISENVYTTVVNETQHTCIVVLKDSLGNITDQQQVQFNSTKSISNSNQNGFGNVNSSNDSINVNEELTCKEYCPEVWGFTCFIAYSCWWYLIRAVLLVIALVGIVVIIIILIKKRLFCKCLNLVCCCCCCCKKKNKEHNNNNKSERSDNNNNNNNKELIYTINSFKQMINNISQTLTEQIRYQTECNNNNNTNNKECSNANTGYYIHSMNNNNNNNNTHLN